MPGVAHQQNKTIAPLSFSTSLPEIPRRGTSTDPHVLISFFRKDSNDTRSVHKPTQNIKLQPNVSLADVSGLFSTVKIDDK